MLVAEFLDGRGFFYLIGLEIKYDFLALILGRYIWCDDTALINRRQVFNFEQFQIDAFSQTC
jgi:hypothetical protein